MWNRHLEIKLSDKIDSLRNAAKKYGNSVNVPHMDGFVTEALEGYRGHLAAMPSWRDVKENLDTPPPPSPPPPPPTP
jgi:hypothetical protein